MLKHVDVCFGDREQPRLGVQIRGHVMEQNLLCEDVLAIDDILICQIVMLAGHILNFPIRNILHCVNKIFYGCENAFRAALVSCVVYCLHSI